MHQRWWRSHRYVFSMLQARQHYNRVLASLQEELAPTLVEEARMCAFKQLQVEQQ